LGSIGWLLPHPAGHITSIAILSDTVKVSLAVATICTRAASPLLVKGGSKRRQETGDRRQETGDRRQETGDRIQETGSGVAALTQKFALQGHFWGDLV